MRTTVGELIEQLKQCDPKVPVKFQTGVGEDNTPRLVNGVHRVDRFAGYVTVVIQREA